VNAILEATVQVLNREGFDAATTTRIAEVAGVSIGSLYQYFSHRAFDVRIIAIIRHFLAATGATVRRENVDAAAFVAFQSVRATMLATLLERPPGLDEETLVAEMVDLVVRYLVR
jgi:AcrR family transcriptional regulator